MSPWLNFLKCEHCGSETWSRNNELYSCGTPKNGVYEYDYNNGSSWIRKIKPKLNVKYNLPVRSSYCKELEFAKKVESANALLKSEKAKK
jgi:hypothetical protein